MITKNEVEIMIERLDIAIDQILNINEDPLQDSKSIYPIRNLMMIKRGLEKQLNKEDAEYEFRKTIRQLY